MPPVILEADGLTRHFGPIVAVDRANFQIREGAIFGLLGPNGSGKSTILRMLCGVLAPTAGRATVLGHDCARESELVKRYIGYMSQNFSLYGDLSVAENLDFYGRIYGLSEERLEQRKQDVLALTALKGRVRQLAATLSGGWKQRLALACSLIHEPPVLFLDEPTSGIDPVARRQLWDLLFSLSAGGVTMLVTTHYMDEAERCTEVGYLYQSRLLVQGKPDALKKLPAATPPGTARWELRMESPVWRLQWLRDMPGVRDATLFGETIHLLASDELRERDLRAAIGSVEQFEMRPISATLEDVFVTLTRAADALGDAGDVKEAFSLDVGESPPGAAEAYSATVSGSETGAGQSARPSAERGGRPRGAPWSMSGYAAILIKEFFHLRREPSTLFFVFVIPVLQTIIFGIAIDTQIENIPTVVFDQDGRQPSRDLVDAFANTRTFAIIEFADGEEAFHRALQSGRAKVGLRIPPDFSNSLLRGEQAFAQVLIDGSDSQVATTALSSANLLGTTQAIAVARGKAEAYQIAPARDERGQIALPIELRPRLLYNPELKSSHFFVPGLAGIILQLVTLFLTAFAIVRERERGTLEQLFVTPVGRMGLLLGKLTPYAIVGFIESLIVLNVMVYGFGVPIEGSIGLLLAMALLFLICSLGLGLLVSTLAATQLSAMQYAFIIMMPSVLLSGFVFPRSEMPWPIYVITFCIPVTYFIEILRGIVLRGADARDILPHFMGLVICWCVILVLAVTRFRKRLA